MILPCVEPFTRCAAACNGICSFCILLNLLIDFVSFFLAYRSFNFVCSAYTSPRCLTTNCNGSFHSNHKLVCFSLWLSFSFSDGIWNFICHSHWAWIWSFKTWDQLPWTVQFCDPVVCFHNFKMCDFEPDTIKASVIIRWTRIFDFYCSDIVISNRVWIRCPPISKRPFERERTLCIAARITEISHRIALKTKTIECCIIPTVTFVLIFCGRNILTNATTFPVFPFSISPRYYCIISFVVPIIQIAPFNPKTIGSSVIATNLITFNSHVSSTHCKA